jgi:uncharacterized MnhB-related membrane protein
MVLWALVDGLVVCGLAALFVPRLLAGALWLATVSAVAAAMLYALGAVHVAVIELSVGVGLVTVLLVYAITLAGDSAPAPRRVVSRWLAAGLALAAVGLVAALIFPFPGPLLPRGAATASDILWRSRGLDMLVQVAMICAGVLGVAGLLTARARGAPSAIREESTGPRALEKVPR